MEVFQKYFFCTTFHYYFLAKFSYKFHFDSGNEGWMTSILCVKLLPLLKFPAVYSRVTSDITPLFDRFYFYFIICLIIAFMSQLISLCHMFNVVKTYVKSHLNFRYLRFHKICFYSFNLLLVRSPKKSREVSGLYKFNKNGFILSLATLWICKMQKNRQKNNYDILKMA